MFNVSRVVTHHITISTIKRNHCRRRKRIVWIESEGNWQTSSVSSAIQLSHWSACRFIICRWGHKLSNLSRDIRLRVLWRATWRIATWHNPHWQLMNSFSVMWTKWIRLSYPTSGLTEYLTVFDPSSEIQSTSGLFSSKADCTNRWILPSSHDPLVISTYLGNTYSFMKSQCIQLPVILLSTKPSVFARLNAWHEQ